MKLLKNEYDTYYVRTENINAIRVNELKKDGEILYYSVDIWFSTQFISIHCNTEKEKNEILLQLIGE